MKTFKQAWAEKERLGYRYGRDALEQVRLGWDMRGEQVEAAIRADERAKTVAWVAEQLRTEAHNLDSRGNARAEGLDDAADFVQGLK